MSEAAVHDNGEVWHQQPHKFPTDALVRYRAAICGSLVYSRRSEGKLVRDCRIIKRERSWEKTVSCNAVCGCHRTGQHHYSGDAEGRQSKISERNASVLRESARETMLGNHDKPMLLRIQNSAHGL